MNLHFLERSQPARPFTDRTDAGRQLAERLQQHRSLKDVLVLGLPRGGVPVAFEVAQALHAPLDVMIVRKLGAPGQPEFALGAVASGGVTVFNPEASYFADTADLEAQTEYERGEIARRERLYRADRPACSVENHTVILVDDGVATGASMRAAVQALRQLRPRAIIVAAPVASREACDALRLEADEVVCLMTPAHFAAVGQWYERFSQTSDEEVCELLTRAASASQ